MTGSRSVRCGLHIRWTSDDNYRRHLPWPDRADRAEAAPNYDALTAGILRPRNEVQWSFLLGNYRQKRASEFGQTPNRVMSRSRQLCSPKPTFDCAARSVAAGQTTFAMREGHECSSGYRRGAVAAASCVFVKMQQAMLITIANEFRVHNTNLRRQCRRK